MAAKVGPIAPQASRDDIDDIEVDAFITAMSRRHGYDFTGYAPSSLKRRVLALAHGLDLPTVSELTARVLREDEMVPQVIAKLSVPVSEMFRNPAVFRKLRDEVFPVLASYPQINIWQAGCAHGQEVYSLAILLKEAGLYDRCQIYATDFSDEALAKAQEGIFPIRDARLYSENYLAAGGRHTLSDYYHARYDFMKLDERLKERVTFANHNLVCDGVFTEAQLILCRNVLIYFSDTLQDRVLGLFRSSLSRGGFLCLGNRESIRFAPSARDFVPLDAELRLYRNAGGLL
ncbi:CheR family methyltransferase [Stenotrophomonas sp. PS02298]|jgi:chemotaxis protein methyltransferase CheR|uniref:CheR family methyltransferase n=1 Tax=Stenotrophomonas sp. PS02298 TaxID=2991424 RepID=UPI000DB101FE|nr:CheR family methyltransferase [Stenotrophomonas sp. PS02298]PZU26392.1 MAG: chemotaxis protein CheR [Stenotrophomonas sp.]